MLGASAGAGAVGAHVLAYALAIPDAGHRHVTLDTTGHGYLSWAAVAAVALGVAAAVGTFARGARIGLPAAKGSGARRVLRDAAVLGLCQSAAFVVMESAERLSAGLSPTSLPVALVAIGVAAQVVVALLAAVALALADGGGRRVARIISAGLRGVRAPSPAPAILADARAARHRSPAREPAAGRAPPRPVLP